MSESGKSKRQEDAESIIGKANAEELEVADQNLVGRSAQDIDPNAVVERKDKGKGKGKGFKDSDSKRKEKESEKESSDGKSEDEDDEDEEDSKGPPFGGAKSLADAEIFMVERADGEPILMDSLSVLADVLTNIAGDEYGLAIRTELADWQTRLDAQVLKTLNSVQGMLDGREVTMPEANVVEEPQAEVTEAEVVEEVAAEVEALPEAEVADGHPLDAVFASLRASYDEARETPADQAVRLQMLQAPVEELAAVIKASIDGDEAPVTEASAGGGVTLEQIQAAVAAGVAPIAAELQALKSASTVIDPNASPAEPVRRALQTAALGVGQSGPPVEVTIPTAEYANQKSEHNVTPGLRNLVRRTVGLGN